MKVPAFILVSLLLVVSMTNGQNRQLSFAVDPGCSDSCPGTLVHVTADGPNDTVHHIWDFTKGEPVILLVLTKPNDTLRVDWAQFMSTGASGSLKFDEKPSYVFAVAMDKIIDFDDADDLGYYNPESKYNKTEITGKALKWGKDSIKHEKAEIEAVFRANYTLKNIGHPSITLRAFGNRDHTESQPHIRHTSKASVMEVVLDHITPQYNSSRFAISLLLFSSNSVDDLPQIKRYSSDDEHSPGVFTTGEIFTTDQDTTDLRGYLQWKTIAYTSAERIHAQSTSVNDLKATRLDHPEAAFNGSSVSALVGDAVRETPSHSLVMSFGSKDDGFYAKKMFTSFSFAVGVGEPAEETFSLLVTLILSIGLGVLVVLAIVATVCIIARKVSRTRDELFLTQ